MDTTDTNWVTGEASLWLDNDEYAYHESRRIVSADIDNAGGHRMVCKLEALLIDIVPNANYGIIQQIADIDWDVVIDRLITDIKEGYE